MPVHPPAATPDDVRDDGSVSRQRGVREVEIRATNTVEDRRTDSTVVLHSAHAAADTVALASAEWGPPVAMAGFDRIDLFLDFEHDGDISEVLVEAQACPNKSADSPLWATVMEPNADQDLIAKAWVLGVSADARVCWTVPRVGYYMRFRISTDGSDREGSRAVLRGIRSMNSA